MQEILRKYAVRAEILENIMQIINFVSLKSWFTLTRVVQKLFRSTFIPLKK